MEFIRHVVQPRANVFAFSYSAIVDAFAQSRSPKVESQHRHTAAMKRLRRLEHHFVVHRAAEQWVGMAHNGGKARVCLRRGPKHRLDSASLSS